MQGNKLWINKLNQINSRILMPAVFITFVLFNTVINLWLDKSLETIQNLLVIGVVGIVIINFLLKSKEEKMSLIKANYLLIAYIVIRAVSFINSGMDYSVARTIFFEVFFLIGITKITIDKRALKKIYIYGFLIIEFILTLLCLIIYYMGEKILRSDLEFLNNYTYYLKNNTAAIFSNPNTAGIMAAFAIILMFAIYRREWSIKIKVFASIFAIYNVLFLFTQNTRSAEIGFLAVILVLIFKTFSKKIDKKRLCHITLIGCLIIMAGAYTFIQYNISIDPRANNDLEERINELSSNRYAIWKGCIIEQNEHKLFGAGNLALEEKNRKLMFTEENEYRYPMRKSANFGPHNGYIGMISGTGWLGFIIFISLLFQRINRAKALNKYNWYLLIVFIFAINLFESLFILNRFFTCFYLFLILEMDDIEELSEG
ncbi:MAG: O-antigen ligase family protein [Lachnospirales bacterium]